MAQSLQPPGDAATLLLMPMNDAALTVVGNYQGAKFALAMHPERRLPHGWTHPAWPPCLDGRVWTWGITISVPESQNQDNDDGADIVLATIGRTGSIKTNISQISAKHCIFEYARNSGLVVVRDGSYDRSLQFYGDDSTPLDLKHSRKVVHPRFNRFIGLGGPRKNRLLFELVWPEDQKDATAFAAPNDVNNNQFTSFCTSADWNVNGYVTRVHLPQTVPSNMNCFLEENPWNGRYASVHRAIDVDRATYIAVKRFSRIPNPDMMLIDGQKTEYVFDARVLAYLKREAEALARLKHPNIIRILGLTHNEQGIGICMPLQIGNLFGLVDSDKFTLAELIRITCGVVQQMTSALQYLNDLGIAHFDIKPGNILYNGSATLGYHFSLADFGSCNQPYQPGYFVGTGAFASPEAHSYDMISEKSDIWSLYVTILWVLNTLQFRDMSNRPDANIEHVMQLIHNSQREPGLRQFQSMANPFPQLRPSAKDIRRTLFPKDSIHGAITQMEKDFVEGGRMMNRICQLECEPEHELETHEQTSTDGEDIETREQTTDGGDIETREQTTDGEDIETPPSSLPRARVAEQSNLRELEPSYPPDRH